MLKLFKTRYILLTIFVVFQLFRMIFGDALAQLGMVSHVFGVIEAYTTLMILPLMYDMVYSAVSYRKPRQKLRLNYVPAIMSGTLTLATIIYTISTRDLDASIAAGMRERAEGFIPHTYNHLMVFILYDIFNIVLYLQTICFFTVMTMKFYRYRQKIFSYYVDLEETDYPYVRNVCICSSLAIVSLYIELIAKRHVLMNNAYWAVAFIIFSLMMLCLLGHNLRRITGKTVIMPFSTTEFTSDDVIAMAKQVWQNTGSGKKEAEFRLSLSDSDNLQTQEIEGKINTRTSRTDKPYLREGITLNAVADEMDINSRTLSLYINTGMKQNFNNWINTLRIEEAKRIIAQDMSITMLNVAVKCGFADTAMLSKNFKRIVGCTPTAYKQMIKEGRDAEW